MAAPEEAVECARPGRAGRIAMIAVVCASSPVRAGNAPHMTKRHCAHIELAHWASFSLKLLVPSGSNRCQLPALRSLELVELRVHEATFLEAGQILMD
jgi:hypothetical protein